MKNQATLDGTTGLALEDSGSIGANIFEVYNKSIQPTTLNTPVNQLFDEGFDTIIAAGAAKTDFVLNEALIYDGNDDLADLTFSRIPFQVAFAPGARTVTFQFRPDPALYVAIMTGQLEMVVTDVDLDGAAVSAIVDCSFMVSGWKSIMGNPDKKKKSSRKRMTSKKARK
jgi:hypothetical protein